MNLELTPEGIALMEDLYPKFNAAETEVVAGLSERNLRNLTKSLRLIVNGLDAVEHSATD